MKKLLLTALSTCFLAQAGFALSPLDRSSREICDIVSSRELRRLVPAVEVILDVRRIATGYIITTNRFQIIVDVIYPPAAQGGEEGTPSYDYHEPTEQK